MLFYEQATDTTWVLDHRERAPRSAVRDMYVEKGKVVQERSLTGHAAVGTPGLIAGLMLAHERWGTYPREKLIGPSVQLCEQGFLVYPELARSLREKREEIGQNRAMKKVFFKEDKPLTPGMRLVQTDLGKTLRSVARYGHDGFYRGWVAKAMVSDMVRHKGIIQAEDLERYKVRLLEPVSGNYRGYRIVSMPPPSSGGIHLVQMLNILESCRTGPSSYKTASDTHYLIEAMRQAYADRSAYLGDPDFYHVPIKRLTDKAYAKKVHQKIPKTRARRSSQVGPGLDPIREGASTTHFSIVDQDGNIVAATQTINTLFGACVMASGTGIVLNNEMDDFSALPGTPNAYGLVGGEANAIAPEKTPLSSMSPTIVFKDNRPCMILGSPGGSKIITAVLQVMLNVLDYNLSPMEAVFQGRLHHQWRPDHVLFEKNSYPVETLRTLEAWGHKLRGSTDTFGDVQAIFIQPDNVLVGISDPRGEGKPIGY